jgi:hypothetical protein
VANAGAKRLDEVEEMGAEGEAVLSRSGMAVKYHSRLALVVNVVAEVVNL